jgi:HEAT repeat protein
MTHHVSAIDGLGGSMLSDRDELVRHEAAEALGEIGLAEALPWLEQARGDASSLVRRTVEIAENNIQLNLSK